MLRHAPKECIPLGDEANRSVLADLIGDPRPEKATEKTVLGLVHLPMRRVERQAAGTARQG